MEDSAKDPAVVLQYLVGRPLAATEVQEAFGYRKSAYYKAAREGRLITADNLIRVARYFGLNPVDLQVRYGLIESDAVSEYTESEPRLARTTTRRGATKRTAPRSLRTFRSDPSTPPV